MKKTEVFLSLTILLLILLLMGIAYSQPASVGIGITITDSEGPVINLILPLNSSGIPNENVTFFYNVSDASDLHNCSLIINNKINATNSSIITKNALSSFTVNNTAIGSYNWSINCTDSLGFEGLSDNRTFSVNIALNFNGSSTNLSLVNVTNVTNFVIEVTTSGRINFSDSVDISQGLDLDRYLNISFNKIEINSTALRALNKSATLYLYDLAFTNPRVLRDNEICPSDICKEVSYDPGEGTFAFNVTHFTVYSSEETPVEEQETPPGGAAGGGGGGAGGGGRIPIAAKREFTLSKETLKVILKQGQTKEETFTIKNTGDLALSMKVDLEKLIDFVYSPTPGYIDFVLQPDEEQTILVGFKAEEDQTPNVYPREIHVKESGGDKIISTVIEVESAQPLFDVDVEVLPEYKSVLPGDEIFIEVSAFNVRGFGRVDVNLEYSIIDFKGNIITTEHETLAVENQAKFTRELLIPSDAVPGTYVASAKITFGDSVGISSDVFEVKAKAIRLIAIKDYTFFLLLGIVVVIIISVVLVYKMTPKAAAPKTKEEEGKLLKAEEKIKKLEKELSALEGAFRSKLISEESYTMSKERIEKEIGRLKR